MHKIISIFTYDVNNKQYFYGLVKKSVVPLFIFWIIFLLDLELNFKAKLLEFRWELIMQICFFFFVFFCYERDFMKSLSRENQADIISIQLQGTLLIYKILTIFTLNKW